MCINAPICSAIVRGRVALALAIIFACGSLGISAATAAIHSSGGGGSGGTLDITNNAVLVDYPAAGPNPEAVIRQQIISGRGTTGFGATWTGLGITSSTAAADVIVEPESRSVAYADNGTLPLGPYTNFRGETLDDSTVIIRYTRTADATLDGVVNDDDVTIVGATYAPGVPNPNWALGDFDYNGFVDDDDVTLLGVFYNPAATPIPAPAESPVGSGGVAAVPEPGALALGGSIAGVALLSMTRWRRK